jgi:hypothetical protein
MELTPDNLKNIYQIIGSDRGYGVPIEAVFIFEKFQTMNFDTIRIKELMTSEILKYKNEIGQDNVWQDVRTKKRLQTEETLYNVLFCPLEEVPLHINEAFPDIAKWRLENAI